MNPLPCPFCGKEPILRPDNPKIHGNAWGAVSCANARCVTAGNGDYGVTVYDGQDICDERGSAKYIQCAIRRWNRRK